MKEKLKKDLDSLSEELVIYKAEFERLRLLKDITQNDKVLLGILTYKIQFMEVRKSAINSILGNTSTEDINNPLIKLIDSVTIKDGKVQMIDNELTKIITTKDV